MSSLDRAWILIVLVAAFRYRREGLHSPSTNSVCAVGMRDSALSSAGTRHYPFRYLQSGSRPGWWARPGRPAQQESIRGSRRTPPASGDGLSTRRRLGPVPSVGLTKSD